MSQSEMETIQLVSSLGMKDELVAVKNRIVIGMVFSGDKDVIQDASLYRQAPIQKNLLQQHTYVRPVLLFYKKILRPYRYQISS